MTPEPFALWLFETTLAVSILIILVMAARRPVAKAFGPEAAYLLWLAPAARLLMPELAILPRPVAEAAPALFYAAPGAAYRFAVEAPATAGPAVSAAATVLVVWLAGAIAFLCWQFLAQRTFICTLMSKSRAPSPDLAAEAAVIAERRGLKRRFRLRVAEAETGPLVAGVFRPVVVVPRRFETDFSPVERQLALAHEFAHIGRGDLVAALAAIIFRAAQWPNPLAHVAFAMFRADQEAACDASVLSRHRTIPDVAHAYGAAILKAAGVRYAAPAACLSMSHHLKERLLMMKNNNRKSALAGRVAAAALIAAGVAASASYSYAADEDAKKTERVIKKRMHSVNIITADEGETLDVGGRSDVAKVEVTKDGGDTTVRLFDRDGKLLSENVYGPDAALPFEEIVVRGEGTEKRIRIAGGPGHPMAWSSADGMPPMPPLPPGAHGERVMVFVGDEGEDGMHMAHCTGEDGATVIDLMEDDDSEGGRMVTRNVICLNGDDNADPAKRAEALKKAVAHMEERAKAEEKHRAAMIAKLKAEIAKAEKEAKKKK